MFSCGLCLFLMYMSALKVSEGLTLCHKINLLHLQYNVITPEVAIKIERLKKIMAFFFACCFFNVTITHIFLL